MRHLYKLSTTGIITLILASACDIVQPDVQPSDIEATIYAYAGKPAVINLATVSDGLDLKVLQPGTSQFGRVESLVGGKYLMYIPAADFAGKSEEMMMPLLDQNNKVFTNLKLSAKSMDNGNNCSGTSGVYDYAKIKSGERLVIDLLDNDVFCGVGYNGGLIGEVGLDETEDQDIVLSLGPGRQAIFTYNSKPGFTGKIRVLYNLGINWKNGGGYVSYEQAVSNPSKYLEAFTTALIEVDVVE